MPSCTLESPFQVSPATPNCGRILERHHHVLLGVSPFNSQFSDPYLEKLVFWAKRTFDRFDFMLPGAEEVALLLEATGVDPVVAARKTRRELGRKFKALRNALAYARVTPDEAGILQFSDFRENPLYRSIRDQAEHLFHQDPDFRDTCKRLSQDAIAARCRGTERESQVPSEAQVLSAVAFIFAEIPFFVDTPSLLNVPQSLVATHRPWPITECLFSGRLPLAATPNQGVIVLSPLPGSR